MVQKKLPFDALGLLISEQRALAGIGTQTELAAAVGATQQTVSRWEKGESRPRERELPRLADVLKVKVERLVEAAGYGRPSQVVTSVDRPFPLNGLTPDSFERFCFYLVGHLYAAKDAQVHRAGGSGHTQDGIDLSARIGDDLLVFQCKRVQEFGPKKVATAVAAADGIAATRKFLLLSTVASPKTREEIDKHNNWELWDVEDLSQRVRRLPFRIQQELVRIFFRGRQLELLGVPEDGPWMRAQDFFAPFTDDRKLFNHTWHVVGRARELAEVQAALENPRVRAVALLGAGGSGKTRLMKQLLDDFQRNHPTVNIWVAGEKITAKSLEDLGDGAKLLVIDDAQDCERDELAALMRYVSAAQEPARLLLVSRPYGAEAIRGQAAEFAVSGEQFSEVSLDKSTKASATELASQVLQRCGGPLNAAPYIAEVTYDSPLATVVGAQVVAKEGLSPGWLSTSSEFRTNILRAFQDIFTDGIATGLDVDRLRRVLRVVALVQPILPDEPALLRLIKELEDVEQQDASRLLRLLIDGGVLFRRGVRYRLSPDLLADSIVERYCLDASGASSAYAERLFETADEKFCQAILLNLGKLDWLRSDGDTKESRLLSGIWSKLQWRDKYSNPHVTAAAAVAYYQPKQALEFAKRLIAQGHGRDSEVCDILRNVAYNLEFLDEACIQLWSAGREDARALNSHPSHPIRILKELASYRPGKPIEFMEKAADFALEALQSPQALKGAYSPFTMLEGLLETEGHTTHSVSSRAVSLAAFATPFEQVEQLRSKVIGRLLELLSDESLPRAYMAASTLQSALRSPTPALGMQPLELDKPKWDSAHERLLRSILEAIASKQIPSIVLVRICEAVSWHAFYNVGVLSELANDVLGYLDRDLETRTARALLDGWGTNTWPLSDDGERTAFETDLAALAADLNLAYGQAADLAAFLNQMFAKLEEARATQGAEHALINRLIESNLDLAQEIIRHFESDQRTALTPYCGIALGAFLNAYPDDACQRIERILLSDLPHAVALVADALGRFQPPSGRYRTQEVAIIRKICQSKDENVLRVATSLVRAVARKDFGLAVELVCLIDLSAAGRWARDFFALICHAGLIEKKVVSDMQLRLLLKALDGVAELDDYWFGTFLRQATGRVPEHVVDFVKKRLSDAQDNNSWRRALIGVGPERKRGLELLKAPNGVGLLVTLLDWALARLPQRGLAFDFGSTISALCGPQTSESLSAILAWLQGGGDGRASIVAAVLREGGNRLVYDFEGFVSEVLQAGESIGEDAKQKLTMAFYSSAMLGSRSGTPGEPFAEDLQMRAHAGQKLATLSRFDPTYELYSLLLSQAEENIARQARDKAVMDAEDEERG
jgi:DNA-binding XRE family transcriptional regulator